MKFFCVLTVVMITWTWISGKIAQTWTHTHTQIFTKRMQNWILNKGNGLYMLVFWLWYCIYLYKIFPLRGNWMEKYLNQLRHHFLHSGVPRSRTEETKIILPNSWHDFPFYYWGIVSYPLLYSQNLILYLVHFRCLINISSVNEYMKEIPLNENVIWGIS